MSDYYSFALLIVMSFIGGIYFTLWRIERYVRTCYATEKEKQTVRRILGINP